MMMMMMVMVMVVHNITTLLDIVYRLVHADSLPYVEATILELLRYKTILTTARRLAKEDTLVGGYFIPGGTTVSCCVNN